ncbi:MAG: helix-turn-helix domain-containing protein [Kofleriaceae bacterium]
MNSTSDPRQLVADPVSHYYAARSIVAWAQSPTLIGAFHLGTWDPMDRDPVTSLFGLPVSPRLASRFDLVHDLSAIGLLEERVLEFFEQFLAQFAAAIATRVRRLAVVIPGGYVGAAFGGLVARWVVPVFDAFQVCERRDLAFAFLELAPPAVSEIEALYQAHELPPIVVRLRALLAEAPRDSTLESSAADLGVSPRSLQRYLTGWGSSFRRELALARTRVASELLLGDVKVEAVAREVGFATGEAFAVSFQKHTGESPRDFRDAVTRRLRS